jgi:ADP-heptose:LPS heptosyltransferase
MRILVIRTDHLGDVLLATPMMRALSKAGHEVTALVRRAVAPVFDYSPYARAVILEEVAPSFPQHWINLGTWMRRQSFDAILLPYSQPRQLLFASLMSGCQTRVAMWSGLWGRLTFHHCLRSGIRKGERHFSDMLLDCARALNVEPAGLRPDFFLTDKERSMAKQEFARRFPNLLLIGVHPGCAGNTCNLPPNIYGQLAEKLLTDPGIAIIGSGIECERKLFNEWPSSVINHPRYWNACGLWDVRQLAASISHYTAMVVPSTGPLHIAAALGLRTVTPFCHFPPTSVTVWGNLTPGAVAVHPDITYCDGRRKNRQSQCHFGGFINAETLFQATRNLLNAQ